MHQTIIQVKGTVHGGGGTSEGWSKFGSPDIDRKYQVLYALPGAVGFGAEADTADQRISTRRLDRIDTEHQRSSSGVAEKSKDSAASDDEQNAAT